MFRTLRQCYIPVRARNALLGQHWKRMYSSATVRIIKPGTDPSGAGSILEFKRSIHKFNHVEEDGLRIRIIDKDSFSDAMGIEEATDPPPSSVTDLYLDKINRSQISVFNPDNYPDMSKQVCSFLVKLGIVALISTQSLSAPREVAFIDNMATDLMKSLEYDDGRELNMLPCSIRLTVGSKEFMAKTGKEGWRGNDIIWIMQGNKHTSNLKYKDGDIHLASSMIAAYQTNAEPSGGVYPERMIGIKITGDNFYFYSMRMTASYLDDLYSGAPNEDVEVFKYPGEQGLCISVPEDRKRILNHLWSMRCYAVGLTKFSSY